MQKHFIKFFAGIALFGACFFAGCSNALTERESADMTEYGSLVIGNGSRAVDVSELTSAVVTVSGWGMTDISKSSVSIQNGAGEIRIDNIPVGKNRIVTVKSNVDGALIRQIVDVSANTVTPVSVTWSSTPLASVYYNLLKSSNDISGFGETEKTKIASMIPEGVHPSLIDCAKIASDYKTGTISDYILDFGTVSVTANDVNGYTVQVTDISSEKKTVSSDSESFGLRSYPGSWKVIVYDENGTEKIKKDITVIAGETSTVNVSMSNGLPYDFTGKTIVFVKASSAPTIWAWETSGDMVSLSAKLGQKWENQPKMAAATTDYMTDPTGWYMADFSSVSSGGKINFKINSGNQEITGLAGTFWYDGSSCSATNPSPVSGTGEKTLSVSVKNPELPQAGVKIYVSADTAPTIWVWQKSGLASTQLMGYTWKNQPVMEEATGLNYDENWYVFEIPSDKYTDGETFTFILNSSSGDIASGKATTFWYDAKGVCGAEKAFYDSDPTVKPEPVLPVVTIKPASGSTVKTTGSISVTFTNGYDTISSAKVTINGEEFDMGTTAGTFTKTLSDLGIETDGVSIEVSATVTNSVGPTTKVASYTSRYIDPSKEDPFTWDNVNAYFVLTDRFYNGDTTNDHSYFRQNGLSGDENVATFHGGDLAGLTQKLDYFDKLGVNAIWITAPYEQAHGWVSGKDQKFPHYAFHGYYTLDWSSMDQNMGTVEELRTFVNACHSKGIRVIMDIVMNHVGYNNTQDMVTFEHGYTAHTDGWLEKALNPQTGKIEWFANDTVKWDNDLWDNSWFGPWIRSFGYAKTGSEYGGSCGGLPDVRTELTTSVGIAPVHNKKWNSVDTAEYKASYYNPSVAATDWLSVNGNYRTDMNVAPADYQVAWLSAWVREVGIDGFRCDTAKHVEPFRWGQLKDACTAALEAWRNDSSKSKLYNGVDTGAADWDEAFWMTGECFGWTAIGGSGGEYYGTGKFDSMINFSYNGSQGGGTSSSYPSSSDWNTYLSINTAKKDDDNNGNLNNVLTYLSSHDTKLCRPSDAIAQGTMFTLLPGGIQIYYGDESSRPQAYLGCGDTDMMTRGDMNWDDIEGSKKAQVAHWGKVGNFRKYNPAVGAGVGSGTKRTYSGAAGENKVAIGIDGTSVDVKGLFADGTTVYNWYDGTSSTVSGGKVTFAGGTTSQPILVSEKNPATYGIKF
ncbi:MAG: alpha-amylase family glycosyl hydrolase [Treponema porcinum]|uniref:alpha-amylase family glycosyl hydrolase n=1 Tax=Treponema porcinum TaxID=261392 RepID=UPI002352C38D|nr:alpha-amylase family glycosyl hydrolase [Treponema porcinum]MCI6180287.1 alpha-amylase family glycosyl hydrolase [Treponema porcinum]